MPLLEPTVIAGSSYALRHVGPRADVWPASPAANITVLGRTDMVARPLPMSNVPSSPDFVAGSWTSRLDDAGEITLTFPNKDASDGVPWRQRFSPAGHNQFIECYFNGNLEGVFCIDTVNVDQQQVTVHGQDAYFLLKKAYERDLIVVQSPRDVIERATKVWVPTTTDNFPAGSLSAQWSNMSSGGGSAPAIGHGFGLILSIPATGGAISAVESAAVTVPTGGTWSASCSVQSENLGDNFLVFRIIESSGHTYYLDFYSGLATLNTQAANMYTLPFPTASGYALLLESDGEWVSGFVNSGLIGCFRRQDASTTSLQTWIGLGSNGGSSAATVTVTGVLTESLQPFLM